VKCLQDRKEKGSENEEERKGVALKGVSEKRS